MTYYILLPEPLVESEDNNLHTERFKIGEESFGTFYPDHGYYLLEDLADRFPDVLEEVEIKTDQGEDLTVGELLNKLEELTVLV